MSDVDALLAQVGSGLSSLGMRVHERLLDSGFTSYVKTIYVGYEWEGVMAAALYPHSNRVEIALALAEDHPSRLLIDATHLTWKTLPVAAILKDEGELDDVLALVDEACARIKDRVHDVERSSDYFAKSRREGGLGGHRPRR